MTVIDLVRKRMGRDIPASAVFAVLPDAMQKLERLIQRYGEDGRLTQGYIAQLVAEQITQTRFAVLCSTQTERAHRQPASALNPNNLFPVYHEQTEYTSYFSKRSSPL